MYEKFLNITSEFFGVLSQMAPYLLFGFFVAGLLSVLIKHETVESQLGGRGLLQVIKAAIFGVPLPLCSCGVIPVAASLRRNGASRGATTAFLISTPQTGVDSILVTFSLLGIVFAIYRPISAFISGVIGGVLMNLFEKKKTEKTISDSLCEDNCAITDKSHNSIYRLFHYGFVTLPQDIAKPLVFGVLVAGIISTAVPDDYFSGLFENNILTMFVMMLVGVPIYVCATASVPIAAVLIAKGISPGAALVFLMSGPATNSATIATIWKIMGRRATFIYLFSIALTAIGSGIILDYIFNVEEIARMHHHAHWMIPQYVNTVSAFVLVGVLAMSLFSNYRKNVKLSRDLGVETGVKLSVSGMRCNQCALAVERALKGVDGVKAVNVNLKSREVDVIGKGLDVSLLKKAIEDLGYKVEKGN